MTAERNATLIEHLEKMPGVICQQAAHEIRHLNVVILKLRDAIDRAGFAVMETSGDWDIYDVSEKGKAAEAKSLQVATENVYLEVEVKQLRELLAVNYSRGQLYADDGELQDARTQPFIDFKRDSIEDILAKIRERGERAMRAAPVPRGDEGNGGR